MLKGIKLFTRHLRGKKGLLAAVFILGLAGSASSLATPLIGKSFIDAVAERRDFSSVPLIAAALLGLAVVDLLLGTLTRVVHTKLSAVVLVEIRARLFAHCVNAPLEALEKFRHGDLLSRFGTDISKIQTLLVDGALGFIQNLIFLVVAATILFNLSRPLALWCFLGIILALIITAAFRRPIEAGTRGIREVMAGLSHFLSERLGALRAVRLHSAQQEEQQRFGRHNTNLVSKLLKFQFLDAAATGLPGIILTANLAWIYLLGGGLLERSEISLGTFVAFILYQGRLYGPARGLLGLVRNLQEVRVSLDRVTEVLSDEGEPCGQPEAEADGEAGVRLEEISYAYPGNPLVLNGVSLQIVPGERVALFGTSGAGKSTLIQILFGLRRPQQGRVYLGEKSIGYAGSEPFLLHASVEENLRYGNPQASFEALVIAARIAAAHEFVEGLPQGYQTIIGGRGQALSDGQRQRLGIARLVLRRPDILVFDEAFSALDPDTEARVRRNLWSHFQEKIILVVTHRLGGLNEFDRLCLLQEGRLRQVDEHQLLAALVTASAAEGNVESEPGPGRTVRVKPPQGHPPLEVARRSA
ncbi:ABC transporter ATP-binding protein [Geopsychrobacter electrodiphilus]|uniref:ABC transporter ATP-binding protein n=1 Tax=Geopsychrobacter electrodiphilus TaxID=225196 RepID=UPI000370027A|nr:ABC transporter ATP-binding protein [Geopsychrobacter electrodiphilus]